MAPHGRWTAHVPLSLPYLKGVRIASTITVPSSLDRTLRVSRALRNRANEEPEGPAVPHQISKTPRIGLIREKPISGVNTFVRIRMMYSDKTMLALFCLTSIALIVGQAAALPPAQCSPGLMDEVPPRIRKVCAALSTIYELSSAMETYLDDKAYNSGPVLHGNIPLPDSGVKRQDVDHVFLRFGRRR